MNQDNRTSDTLKPISCRVKEAERLTGMSEDALRNMITDGLLRAKRIAPRRDSQRLVTVIPYSELQRVFGME